ncbi:MAG: hypothetical protein H6Q89_2552 [Myxococcaceae bacterium]|nr:hypothetical protein [Myxococcaceae bacterium]
MLTDLLYIVSGGVCLYFGAEWLVRGASGLALASGVRPLVIGLTVVAFGTSAPELVVTVLAALEGKSEIALGNVVGSNIANLGLILGLTALVSPPKVDSKLIRREVPVMVATAFVVPLALYDGVVSRLEGGLLVLAAFAFTGWLLKTTAALPPAAAELTARKEEVTAEAGKGSGLKLAALTLVGLALLVAGGKLFVDGASALALALGMSERVVGLTIVSVGTSLPELATSIVAALRRHSDIAVGNVIGSNIYNVLLILGGGAVAHPLAGSLAVMRTDLMVLVGITLLGTLFLRGGDRRISRPEALALLGTYAAFLGVVAAF